MKTPVTATKDGITLNVLVQPGASKTEWAGILGESIKLRVSAKPIEGEANRAVCEFLCREFAVPKSSIEIVHGTRGRNKLVTVRGDGERLRERARSLGFM